MTRVLLIDDEPALSRLYREMLTDEGHHVVVVDSGAEALAHLEERETCPPQLILVDSRLGAMSGAQFVHRLRMRFPHFGEETKIVAFSAFRPGTGMTEGLEEQVDAYLEKPLDVWTFADEFRRLLAKLGLPH